MIVSLQNVPENLEKFWKKENLKMLIYTKPFYKLFSVVHNYFLWMFHIIERIYDDRIPSKCHQNLRKNCAKRQTWKCEYLLNHSINVSVWFTTAFYECFTSSIGYMMIVSLQHVPKNLENVQIMGHLKMWISTKPCYKLFSVVHNYFLWMFQIMERIYDDRISRKRPRKLRKIVEKGKPENANIY